MGADDQQLELLGALEALGGSAGNGKLRDLLGWDEATYDAVKAPLVASGQLQPGRGRGGSLSLADKVDAGSSAAADRRPAASPRTPRTVSPPTPDPQPSGKQNLSAFIWSVADLLRVAGQAFCNTSALSMKRLMGDQDNIGENLRSYIQAFTPREVIKLMVNLIFIEDDQALTQGGIVRSLYDQTAGTGGMLSVAEEHLVGMNPESYAICKVDMLIKGQDIKNIRFGNTLADDQLGEAKYDYMLSNPPFGVEWKKIQKEVQKEADSLGYAGRFGPGLPQVSDGSLLFLLHLISKMRPALEGGSRFGIALNGSPLFTGGAGSGESEIRRYVQENDLVEAIIGLPTDMFYNTGISTYIWILSNRKPAERKGKVHLIDASSFWQKMRKSLGSKRKELSPEQSAEITRLFGNFEEAEHDGKPISRIFRNEDFGYRTITVERPLRDEAGKVVLGQRGKAKDQPQPDSSLRDTENVPLSEDVQTYFEREVLPHVPDAWIDHEKTSVGYEIPFNRHFYVFTPPRPLEEIDAELKLVTDRILAMIGELSG